MTKYANSQSLIPRDTEVFSPGMRVKLSPTGKSAHITEMVDWKGVVVRVLPNAPQWVEVSWKQRQYEDNPNNEEGIVCSRCLKSIDTTYTEHRSFIQEI